MTSQAGAVVRAKQVIRNVLPELADVPLYVLCPRVDSMLTREMFGGCFGFVTSAKMTATFRPMLEETEQWKGDGICIAIDAESIVALRPDDGWRFVVATALHELAHVLDMRLLARPEPTTEAASESYRRFAESGGIQSSDDKPGRLPAGLACHARRFIRLACHLFFRSRWRGGVLFNVRDMCFASDYAGLELMSSPSAYLDALADEAAGGLDQHIDDATSGPGPPEFTDLWQDDLQRIIDHALAERKKVPA